MIETIRIIVINLINYLFNSIKWLFSVWMDNPIAHERQTVVWSGIVGLFLVFIVEWLRKPRIIIETIEEFQDFSFNKDQHPARNYKFRIKNKNSWFRSLLFKYPASNLKVFFEVYDKDNFIRAKYQGKADSNPNITEEKDVPFALSAITLGKDDKELYPFILYPYPQENTGNSPDRRWLLFEVWAVFLRTGIDDYLLEDGKYKLKIVVKSNVGINYRWFKISLNKGKLDTKKCRRLCSFDWC